jgi:ABC-type phosphate transport system substrate-binding protein
LNTPLRRLLRLRFAGAAIALLLALGAAPARAETVVVVANAQGSVGQLTREEVINVFMGRYRKLPDGSAAVPLDLDPDSPVRKAFYRRLLGKSLEEINAYWARLVFAGRTTPPVETAGPADVLARVAENPHAIGYVDRSYLAGADHGNPGRGVRVVFSLPE